MADDKSTDTTEVVDTSTNEDTSDTDTDFDSDDIFDDVDVSDETEKAVKQTEAESAAADDEAEKDESAEDVPPDETEDTTEAESEDVAKAEDTTAKEREAQAKENFRLREEARKAKAQADQIKRDAEKRNIEQYLEDAGDDEEEFKARQNDVREYLIKQQAAKLNTDRLEVDLTRAVADIDLFRTGTPEVLDELYAAIDDFEENRIIKDKNGNVVEVRGDVYQHLLKKADSIRRLTGIRANQQASAKSAQSQRTLATPVKTPKKGKPDPGLDAFDAEANRVW